MKQLDAEDMRIDLRSEEHIHWLNDVETGRLYWSWPRGLSELRRPVFPGQLHRIQRNLYNVVALVDPGSHSGIKWVFWRPAGGCTMQHSVQLHAASPCIDEHERGIRFCIAETVLTPSDTYAIRIRAERSTNCCHA
jgi:hypothetical protein